MNDLNYIFAIRDSDEVLLNIKAIYQDLGYRGINKNKISEIYNINNLDVNNHSVIRELKSAIDLKIKNDREKIENIITSLQDRWNNVKHMFLNCISEGLDSRVGFQRIFTSYCYLQALPINELDRKDNIIYLDYNRPIDELFQNFIILIAKAILLDKWDDLNGDIFSHSYQSQNKIWLFADIAIDAIFTNTDLNILCDKPSYRYFYNASIGGVNFMNKFRELYKLVNINEFLNQVYIFVYNNYNELIKFKNYLY